MTVKTAVKSMSAMKTTPITGMFPIQFALKDLVTTISGKQMYSIVMTVFNVALYINLTVQMFFHEDHPLKNSMQ